MSVSRWRGDSTNIQTKARRRGLDEGHWDERESAGKAVSGRADAEGRGRGMTATGIKGGYHPLAFHNQHCLWDRNGFYSAELPSNQRMGSWKARDTETEAGEEEGREEESQQLEIKTSSSNPGSGLSWLMSQSQSFPTLKDGSKTSLTSDETVWKTIWKLVVNFKALHKYKE